MMHEIHSRRRDFDLLHFHVDLIHFPFFEEIAARTLTTLHGRLDLKDLLEVYSRWRHYPLVSISDDQRKPLADANWVATIQHGLAENVYTFNERPVDPYLAFLGRISPEKRPDRAITIAKRLGIRLKLAAKVDPADAAYFRRRADRSASRQHQKVFPLLVREDDTIICGHGRLEAMKAEGFTEARVIVAKGWTDEQCRAFGLLDTSRSMRLGMKRISVPNCRRSTPQESICRS